MPDDRKVMRLSIEQIRREVKEGRVAVDTVILLRELDYVEAENERLRGAIVFALAAYSPAYHQHETERLYPCVRCAFEALEKVVGRDALTNSGGES